MTPEAAFSEILRQHAEIQTSLAQLYVLVVVIAFLLLGFILSMFFAAAWSVRTVNRRQEALEGKFTLLIDVLLRTLETRNSEISDGT